MTTDGKVITMQSSAEEKIHLFRAMFCGREDVYAERWESKTGKCGYQPVCRNAWIRGVCEKLKFRSGIKTGCDKCPNRDFEPVSDVVVGRHLRGTDAKGKTFVMGVYPPPVK